MNESLLPYPNPLVTPQGSNFLKFYYIQPVQCVHLTELLKQSAEASKGERMLLHHKTGAMSQEDESDFEEDVFSQLKLPTRTSMQKNVLQKLQKEREDRFVNGLIGLLETSSKRHEESVKEPVALKLKIMANQCVRSWRTERNHVSQSLAKYKRRSSSSGGNSDLWTQHSKIRFKAEPERANLTKFLSSLEVEMADAVASLQEKIPQKPVNKDEFMMRRPSQLVQVQETVGGTEKDQLKNARKDLLGKLSKQCAFHMVHEQTPLKHRANLRRILEEVHGTGFDENFATAPYTMPEHKLALESEFALEGSPPL